MQLFPAPGTPPSPHLHIPLFVLLDDFDERARMDNIAQYKILLWRRQLLR